MATPGSSLISFVTFQAKFLRGDRKRCPDCGDHWKKIQHLSLVDEADGNELPAGSATPTFDEAEVALG
jgi:hypothetical protein